MQKEITTYVEEISNYATMDAIQWHFQDYLNMGEVRMHKILALLYDGKYDEISDEEVQIVSASMTT